jgi:AraC-like DNA-binding protein
MPNHPATEPRLTVAFTGNQNRQRHGWTDHLVSEWVVDMPTGRDQMQRVADGEPFLRESGLIAVYAPLTPYYEMSDPADPTIDSFAVFSAAGAEEAMLRPLVGAAGYCHIEDHDGRLRATLQLLGCSYRTRSPGHAWTVRGLLLELLGLLAETQATGPQRRYLASRTANQQTLVSRVQVYLDAHLSVPIAVAELAAAMGMSESAFAHEYPRHAQETPYQAILRSKITAAKRLLLSDGLSVQATARRLGFSTPFNFSRAFKRIEGHPPSCLTQRHRSR